MALTYTPPSKKDFSLPEFELPGVEGKLYKSKDFESTPLLLVMFICNHCPYVQAIEDRYIQLRKEFDKSAVTIVGICSNDPVDYPEDATAELYKRWSLKNYDFPYLVDEKQEVAKSFDAVCTPDIYLFKNKKLAYRGRLDDSWKDSSKVQRQELKLAIQQLLKQDNIDFEPIPSMGCSIKWK